MSGKKKKKKKKNECGGFRFFPLSFSLCRRQFFSTSREHSSIQRLECACDTLLNRTGMEKAFPKRHETRASEAIERAARFSSSKATTNVCCFFGFFRSSSSQQQQRPSKKNHCSRETESDHDDPVLIQPNASADSISRNGLVEDRIIALSRGRMRTKKDERIFLLPRRQRHGPRDGRARRRRGADDGLSGLDDRAGVERLELDPDRLRGRGGGGGGGRRGGAASLCRRCGGGRPLRESNDLHSCAFSFRKQVRRS